MRDVDPYMRWVTIIFGLILSMNVASFELHDLYPYASDPLADRERESQSPRLFWEPAQSIDDSVKKGFLSTASFDRTKPSTPANVKKTKPSNIMAIPGW